MNEESAKEYLKNADSNAARQAVEYIANELDEISARVSAYGLATGPRRAVGAVAQMGADLAKGALMLFAAERWYSGAALVRQLIEVEYLIFLFASNPQEPELWLTPTEEQVRRMFLPKAMRMRSNGRFDEKEYWLHCEHGGHPRAKGSIYLKERLTLIQDNSKEFFDPSILWVDLAQHLERLWGHFELAVRLHSPTNVYPERFAAVRAKIAEWRMIDPLPSKI